MRDELDGEPFEILAFPCNQFGSQEPHSNAEIKEFATSTFGFKGKMMAKIEVNGKGAHPLYKYMRAQQTGILGSSIKWNFTKFLISHEGVVLKRYGPPTHPDAIRDDINAEIAKAKFSANHGPSE
eukprot:TRINITY_DN1774_c0_g1_i1.p1 TRINITY_DN1774_c0_g1~~TRINITY_DN1774_c0_g1_i1.p1  ORF type:complete len:125 (-),score=43.06 TRINITY_DN1774_c0_g1_i1:442-816(-)